MNGSIHVRELLTVLQQNDIPYRKAAPGFAGVLLVVLAVAAALGVCAALLLRLRRRRTRGRCIRKISLCGAVRWS